MVERRCVGCWQVKDRTDLIKITADKDSESLAINPNNTTFGRSAYLCYNQKCIELALKKSKLNKALKTSAVLEKATLLEQLNQEN